MAQNPPASNMDQVFCPNCGTTSSWDNNLCPNCGFQTDRRATQAPTHSAAAPQLLVEYIGPGVRWLAALTDGILLVVAVILIALIGFFLIDWGDYVREILFILYLASEVVSTGLKGQTLGKKALGIMVVDAQGNAPGLWRAFLREIPGKFISSLPLGLGYFWILWDPRKRGWHDHIAGTFVVRKDQFHRHSDDSRLK